MHLANGATHDPTCGGLIRTDATARDATCCWAGLDPHSNRSVPGRCTTSLASHRRTFTVQVNGSGFRIAAPALHDVVHRQVKLPDTHLEVEALSTQVPSKEPSRAVSMSTKTARCSGWLLVSFRPEWLIWLSALQITWPRSPPSHKLQARQLLQCLSIAIICIAESH